MNVDDHSTRERRNDTRSIAEQAADWVVELADGGPQEHASFLKWVTESPRHVEEYLLAATVYRSLDGVDASREIDLQQTLSEAALNVVALEANAVSAPAPPVSRARRWGWPALAAVAALISALGVSWWMLAKDTTYSTGFGELRSIELADGSVIDLNTQSRIQVHFSKDERTVQLLSGEALFKVEADATRPFTVHADKATIRVLGTRFNVHRRAQETAVSVLEGAVRVSGEHVGGVATAGPASKLAGVTELTAGNGARVSSKGEVTSIVHVDTDQVTAWRERRLVFVDDKLADIVAQFNRYNASPHLRVEGDFANNRQLTAVFDSRDPQSLVQFLRMLGEFEVESTGDEIVVRQLATPGEPHFKNR